MSALTDTQAVETVYVAAKALLDASEKLDRIPSGRRAELDALLDRPVYPGDFDSLAKTLEAIADQWKFEIEPSEAEAEETEDRRRDNPLEPDFRRVRRNEILDHRSMSSLLRLLQEAMDSRAPDLADAEHPGWSDRARAAVARALGQPTGGDQ